jgi:hypothetical protein
VIQVAPHSPALRFRAAYEAEVHGAGISENLLLPESAQSGSPQKHRLGQLACNCEQNWLTTSQIPAESELREHVVFHVHNDYARLQAQHFGVRKRVAD